MAKIILTRNDYGSLIKDVNLSAVIGSDDLRTTAEAAAEKEASAYLRNKYDLTVLFPTILEHSTTATYEAGQMVYKHKSGQDLFFTAKQAVTAGATLEEGDDWAAGDPRDPLIKEILIDLALYRLYTRLAPNQIPETRVNRRDDQIQFLKRVANFSISVDWPEQDPEATTNLTWGSKTRYNKDY